MATLESLNTMLKELLSKQVTKEHFDSEIGKMNKKIEKQEKKINNVTTRLEKMENDSKKMINEIYQEIYEQDQRKKNVIIFGLQEQRNENDKVEIRKKEQENVINLLTDMKVFGPDDECIYMRTYRLGRLNPMAEKPRPLKIELGSFIIRDQVFLHAKNLKGNKKWQKISIVPDLTKTQLCTAKAKRKELLASATKKNNELSSEDEENEVEWKVLGNYSLGNLRLQKTSTEFKGFPTD